MIERYWRTVGGALFLEFPLVRKSPDSSPRYLDALIVTDMPEQARRWSEAVVDGYTPEEVVGGRSVIAVQAKHDPSRLSMGLLGQTLFAVELLRRPQARFGARRSFVPARRRCAPRGIRVFPQHERRGRRTLAVWPRATPILGRTR